MVSPSHYFTTKRALATGNISSLSLLRMHTQYLNNRVRIAMSFCIFFLGISMSGSCLGAFVLAPLSSYLSENYGWKATVGLYAGSEVYFEMQV